MEEKEDFALLMADAHTGEPTLREGLGKGSARHMEALESVEEQHLLDPGEDPNLLPRQRWGVVVPEGRQGDELLGHIQELVAWRQEDQGGRPVQVYRVPAALVAAGEKDAGLFAAKHLYERGIFAVYANHDTSVLQLLPPLVLSDEEADEIVAVLRGAFS